MKRFHQLSGREVEEWRKARMEAGREKYHNIDHKRYGIVDIAEEALDSLNIIERMIIRWSKDQFPISHRLHSKLIILWFLLEQVLEILDEIDRYLPDKVCTDEEGGERIWWSDEE